jgi:hypothetical protein
VIRNTAQRFGYQVPPTRTLFFVCAATFHAGDEKGPEQELAYSHIWASGTGEESTEAIEESLFGGGW